MASSAASTGHWNQHPRSTCTWALVAAACKPLHRHVLKLLGDGATHARTYGWARQVANLSAGHLQHDNVLHTTKDVFNPSQILSKIFCYMCCIRMPRFYHSAVQGNASVRKHLSQCRAAVSIGITRNIATRPCPRSAGTPLCDPKHLMASWFWAPPFIAAAD